MIVKASLRIIGKIRFLLNEFLLKYPWFVAQTGGRFTIVDGFGTPGDTILTATVCRNLKFRFPRLQINCVTPNPDLLRYDPSISQLNAPASLPIIKFWYYDLIAQKCPYKHVLEDTMLRLGMDQYDRRAKFYLSEDEILDAKKLRDDFVARPFITINVQSREHVKTWFTSSWQSLLNLMADELPGIAVVQLGTEEEPTFGNSVIRFAGKLKIRESVALQSLAILHIGCVSFLMHSANGVDVPSVIIYGGRETPDNSGYEKNINLYVNLPCSPCWLHDSCGDICLHDHQCMNEIKPDYVFSIVKQFISRLT